MSLKKILFGLTMLTTLAMTVAPAEAQYHHRHRRRMHCYYRHHRRICRAY